ncbi:aspartyl protease family protein [Actinomadura rupiterrae]|uniref:aspartyl protease family protein n=1 Tax=Actinomadura rupiterrae TaxID=559627 RepID=UPI0020A360C5|nr:aspartyl protease family protein [Actinomadura rupiterrae]MCP2342773.1 hypothetical protein [Actinomadura rupiterrae]
MSFPDAPSRRRFLKHAGLAATAAATAAAALPLAGSVTGTATAATGDPDRLFKAGRFAEAERGYRRRLRANPKDARAAAQLGYLALLSNRFGNAERYLSEALTLNAADAESKRRLAECYVRQDRHDRAIPLLNEVGTPAAKASATQYAHLDGPSYRISGKDTRVPFRYMDPLPVADASVNGSAPKPFLVDTYATLDLSPETAKELGLRAVASNTAGVANNRPVVIYFGVLDSFRIGGIEIRNLPVQWTDGAQPPTLPDGSKPAGAFGTTIFYHFLTTMDYARRALVLRRREHARRTNGLPLWLAGDHYPCSVGTIGSYGPRLVTIDTGGIGHGLDTTVEIAERAGIPIDRAHPLPPMNGTNVYPVHPSRISLGHAVGRNILGYAAEKIFPGLPGPGLSPLTGFDLSANFTHEFFKPYAVTFDYRTMRLHLSR